MDDKGQAWRVKEIGAEALLADARRAAASSRLDNLPAWAEEGLYVATLMALIRSGVGLHAVPTMGDRELLALRGIGRKRLAEIRSACGVPVVV